MQVSYVRLIINFLYQYYGMDVMFCGDMSRLYVLFSIVETVLDPWIVSNAASIIESTVVIDTSSAD